MFPADDADREELLNPAVEALRRFENNPTNEASKTLEKEIAPVISGLHAFGRGPDGEWLRLH